MVVVCMIQSSPNRSFKPEFVLQGLEDEYKSIHTHELINQMSLFGRNVFLSGKNPLGTNESDIENLTFEKSIVDKNLTFREVVRID